MLSNAAVLSAVVVRAALYRFIHSVLSDLEKKIQQLIKSKEDKAAEVSTLLDTVDSIRREISKRAETYPTCTA